MSRVSSISMHGISKRYPGVRALQNVNFSAQSGEVMAIVGENGAGKSTLLKILAGAVKADSGWIEISGERVEVNSPIAAKSLGISVIYQELNLARHLSVGENLFVGRELKSKLGLVDFKSIHSQSQQILDSMGLRISSRTLVGDLNIAHRQMIEIAKALLQESKVVVMDEPTSSLTTEETTTLFRIIKDLKQKGVCVIYVSHRMSEIFEICDAVTILRDGQLVEVKPINKTNASEICNLMVGRDLSDLYGQRMVSLDKSKEPILSVSGLRSGKELKDISFELHPGEIVALAGLVGSGRSEAAMAIFGARRFEEGQITLAGKSLKLRRPKQAIDMGIALVPEDRKLQGLFLHLSVRHNMSSASLREISNKSLISRRKDQGLVEHYSDALSLRKSAREVAAGTLSGGNQQKIVLGRWLAKRPKVLILDEPTRGVDVGAKAEIYQIIRQIASEGVGVLMISSELTEVLGLADRIIVMREGIKVAELAAKGATESQIITLATGVEEEK